MAQSDLDMWRQRARWAERMSKHGILSRAQVHGDQSNLQSANIAAEKTKEELRVLRNFAMPRMHPELEAKIAEARRGLQRIRERAHIHKTQTQAVEAAKKQAYDQILRECEELEHDIGRCRIRGAPERCGVPLRSCAAALGRPNAPLRPVAGRPRSRRTDAVAYSGPKSNSPSG